MVLTPPPSYIESCSCLLLSSRVLESGSAPGESGDINRNSLGWLFAISFLSLFLFLLSFLDSQTLFPLAGSLQSRAVDACVLSCFSCVLLLTTLWTVAHQAPLSMTFFRQEYWSGLPFPAPGDLIDPGMEPRSPALQANSLPSEPPEKCF